MKGTMHDGSFFLFLSRSLSPSFRIVSFSSVSRLFDKHSKWFKV
jgi:hypothetical protein